MVMAVKFRALRPAVLVVLVLLGAIGCAGSSAAENSADAMTWLKKIATASRQLNYAGTFVYQHGHQMETSRIAHIADAGGEREKLETLDGPPREIIRNNENVTCYLPDSRTTRRADCRSWTYHLRQGRVSLCTGRRAQGQWSVVKDGRGRPERTLEIMKWKHQSSSYWRGRCSW